MSTIYLPSGASQVPQDVQDKLKAIDPRLELIPYQTAYNIDQTEPGKISGLTWRWVVAMKWPEGDPRWRMVDQGYPRDKAFDRIGDLPADIPLDQVPSYLKQALRPTSTPRHIYEGVSRWNEDQMIRNGEATMDFAEELIRTNAGTMFEQMGMKIPKVYQYNPEPKKKLKRGEAVE